MMNDKITSVIEYNCRLLKLPMPRIDIKPTAFFATPTTRAYADNNKIVINIVYAKHYANSVFDLWLDISHECRHLWQIKHGYDFQEYKTSENLNVINYNAQFAEIDAHAWATLIMINKFGVKPKYEDVLPFEIVERIENRIAEIRKEYDFEKTN